MSSGTYAYWLLKLICTCIFTRVGIDGLCSVAERTKERKEEGREESFGREIFRPRLRYLEVGLELMPDSGVQMEGGLKS
jgi:hypothetical protein